MIPRPTLALSHQRGQVAGGRNALRLLVWFAIARISMAPRARVEEILCGANGRQGIPCDVHFPGSAFGRILHGHVQLLRGLPTGKLQSQNRMHELSDAGYLILFL